MNAMRTFFGVKLRLSLLALGAFAAAGCFGGGGFMGPKDSGKVEISEAALQDYLAGAEVNRPEVAREAWVCLKQGKVFRKRIVDQKTRWTLLTIWVDKEPRNTLHLQTSRDETCPKCKGTGKRQWDNDFMKSAPFDTRCLQCDVKGVHPNHTEERKYVLSYGDYAAGAAATEASPVQAPAEVQTRIDKLPSQDPRERLAACEWLDKNYVRSGASFQSLMPMLKKARWYEADPKKKVMVWQFWAGKGIETEKNRAYYRIYADRKSGQVTQKGFFGE
jgi:hypothetical protein